MEVEAPYLQAIQTIAGTTPGEKYKTINIIARQMAQAERTDDHSMDVDVDSKIPDVPEQLMPLIRVEVAKILHNYEGIVEGLKSEDITVVNRALKAKWFFDGSDSSFVNAQYFITNVFPEISLYVRFKVVKKLSVHLKNTAIAADFFLTILQQYDISQAVPLLSACDEDFALRMVIEKRIVLPIRVATVLYRKHPDLVIKYFMLTKPDDEGVRIAPWITIQDYEDLFFEVTKNRLEDFMDIHRTHAPLYLRLYFKLGKKATETFLRTQLDRLVEEPTRYLELLSLKTVTKKLCVAGNFSKVFKSLFPAKIGDYYFHRVNKYLKYYKPEEDRVPLILNTFREVYGKDLLSCKNLVESGVVKGLPREDRIKQARLKLEDDKDWHTDDIESSWRCYLPISESMPAITDEISKSSDVDECCRLFDQLVYTCKLNDDMGALLKVLNYIYDTQRNDQRFDSCYIPSNIFDLYDVSTLGSTYWEILNKYIKWVEIDLESSICYDRFESVWKISEAGIHYSLLNRLPLDYYMPTFLKTRTHGYTPWKISMKNSELEKKLLDTLIDFIPKQYPVDDKIWEWMGHWLISTLASSIWNFNNRHRVANGEDRKLSVKDYPWLLEKIKGYLLVRSYREKSFLKLMRENEKDLYYILIGDLDKFWDAGTDVILDILKKYPQRVLDNWKKCLEKVHTVDGGPEDRLSIFIIRSRWYQQLPMNFFNETLSIYNNAPRPSIGATLTLALLTDGINFAKIIEPLIPNDEKVDTDDAIARTTYTILSDISECLWKINPPVPLDLIAKLCVGDYLQMALRSVMSVCHRVSVANVYKFAKTLTDRRVSVMKHGIRMVCLVAPVEELYTFLNDLWNMHSHLSIRQLVFLKICDLFSSRPDSRSWHMFRTCLDTLDAGLDYEVIFEGLPGLGVVPSEYIYDYIETVLNVLEYVEEESENPKLYIGLSSQFIRNIGVPTIKILPEEYCQYLIQKYLFVFDYDSEIFEAGKVFTINNYLLGSEEYNEGRFKFFGDFFRDCVEEYWDKSHPKNSDFYPMNFMVRKFFTHDQKTVGSDRHFESLLEIFQSALRPHQDAVSYLNLVYSIEHRKSKTSADFGARMIQKIPEIVEVLSPACLNLISDRFHDFISTHAFGAGEYYIDIVTSICEVLANSGVMHCVFIATDLLFHKSKLAIGDERLRVVVNALCNFHHPSISWMLNQRLATPNLRTECPTRRSRYL